MIKKIAFYVALVSLLSAFQCDDDYMPDEVVENLGLIAIEDNKKVFSVGDYIFITTSIQNEQTTEAGNIINLRNYLFETETSLNYSLAIYTIASNNEEVPYLIENAQEINGAIEFNAETTFFNISSPYDETNTVFSSKIGVKLSQAGTYTLKTSTI